jgi:inorganic pyrophosphatase
MDSVLQSGFNEIPSFASPPDVVNVIIDTLLDCRNKFRYDPEIGLFRLRKILPVGASFPYDFGFIPGTTAEDGDPLDILLLDGRGYVFRKSRRSADH